MKYPHRNTETGLKPMLASVCIDPVGYDRKFFNESTDKLTKYSTQHIFNKKYGFQLDRVFYKNILHFYDTHF